MSLLNIIKMSHSFGGKKIFHEMGLNVESHDRIGLVGPNGSGKTTLLRLIMGEIPPESGEVRLTKGTMVGYLPQDIQETLDGPLLESIYNSAPGRKNMAKGLKRVEVLLKAGSSNEDQTQLAERLAEIHMEINLLETNYPRHQAEKILVGLGFDASNLMQPVSSLSGGWKMRAALASLLYQRPDLLLLDEPTNHLDIPSIHWLEQYLADFSGAMILVSHDRDFINRQIRKTISFEPEGIKAYSGNYDAYLKAREEEQKSLDSQARRQEQRIKEAEKFIERFRAKSSKARQAQSKIKLVKKIELIKTHRSDIVTRFSFPDVPQSGRAVMTTRGLSKQFAGKKLYQDLNLMVLRGDRIAVIGPNGCGKTTLLKIVSGEIDPDGGELSLGHGVTMSYFAQHHSEMLDPQKTVIEEVYNVVPNQGIGFVRGVCGAFLFSGQDVDKPISVLSGGERARVSLAKILVKPGNFLVMDEPTNHLDISSSEALIKALTGYNGTLLFVSHNQSFINRLATKVWDIRNKEIAEYPGNLEEYYYHVSLREKRFPDTTYNVNHRNGEDKLKSKKGHSRKDEKRQRAERRQLISGTIKPIAKEVELLERRISELEKMQEGLEKTLAEPGVFSDKNKSVSVLSQYKAVRKELDALFKQWEDGQQRLEAAKKELEYETL
ncbi:ABC transporter, ATP-binding protein [uncultured Desulfobacterium sp.]|uniref:ABC transporter, ATP-binding protein n=1 Tax=uncultured Desulfobacterium sp. TaxID=201089 RepID=A0A445N349_9BACT|nr:ABC transporter, ATP-binding protein [uncultured Desulfobacterium sp.]